MLEKQQTGKLRYHSRSVSPFARFSLMAPFLVAWLLTTTGCCLPQAIRATCQPYEDIKTQVALKLRARSEARRAWEGNYQRCYAKHPLASDYRKGFERAYIETATGMRGCPPPIPTREMISTDTFTHTYPAAGPWYEGYSIGYASAVARGVDRWRLAPLDPAIAAASARLRCNRAVVDEVPEPSGSADDADIQIPEPVLLPPPSPIDELDADDASGLIQ